MKTPWPSGWRPIVTAFIVWFAHFMLCWAAVEIWPEQWPANQLAWGFTAVALLVMGLHFLRVRVSASKGDLSGWNRRFAHGAIAIATVAVLFTSLPSVVFLP